MTPPLPVDVPGTPAPPALRREPRTWRRADGVAFAAYLVLAGLKLALHPMWRDELQSWDLARTSDGLGQLLARVRYEQHPPLWYVLLWLWSRMGASPRLLQLLLWVLVAATAAVVLRFAPWPRPLRWLLLAGYYPLFEWSTLARPYLLTFLLAIVGAELVRRRRAGLPLGCVLAALVLTDDAYGTVMAIALLAALLADRRPGARGRWRTAALPALAAVVVAGVSDLPPSDYGGPTLGLGTKGIADALRAPLHALAPVPDLGTGFWNTYAVDAAGIGVVVALSIAAAVVVTRELGGDRSARALWLVGLLGTVAVQALTQLPFARFVGTIFVAVVCAFWVRAPGTEVEHRRALAVLAVLLALQVPGSLVALAETTIHPFSRSEAAAAAVARLPGTVISVRDEAAVPVAAYARRPLDMVDGRPHGTYVVWDEQRLCADRTCNATQLLEAALAEAQTASAGGPAYLLTDFEIPPGTDGVELLHAWTGAVVNEEDYWLYAYVP